MLARNSGPELVVRNVTAAHAGFYFCVAVNTLGKALGEAELTVLRPAEAVTEGPANATAPPGGNAVFHCRTPLPIRPFIHWVRISEQALSFEVDR